MLDDRKRIIRRAGLILIIAGLLCALGYYMDAQLAGTAGAGTFAMMTVKGLVTGGLLLGVFILTKNIQAAQIVLLAAMLDGVRGLVMGFMEGGLAGRLSIFENLFLLAGLPLFVCLLREEGFMKKIWFLPAVLLLLRGVAFTFRGIFIGQLMSAEFVMAEVRRIFIWFMATMVAYMFLCVSAFEYGRAWKTTWENEEPPKIPGPQEPIKPLVKQLKPRR